MRKLDITGEKYGRLTAMYRIPLKGNCDWHCICDCGKEVDVKLNNLRNGHTKSCGCLNLELVSERGKVTKNLNCLSRLTHGHTRKGKISPEYRSWYSMKRRCYDPKHKGYKYWGGRGITVCDEWKNDFERFLSDMGERPLGTSIDRIDVDGNYEPSNCRWATSTIQNNNRRNSK